MVDERRIAGLEAQLAGFFPEALKQPLQQALRNIFSGDTLTQSNLVRMLADLHDQYLIELYGVEGMEALVPLVQAGDTDALAVARLRIRAQRIADGNTTQADFDAAEETLMRLSDLMAEIEELPSNRRDSGRSR